LISILSKKSLDGKYLLAEKHGFKKAGAKLIARIVAMRDDSLIFYQIPKNNWLVFKHSVAS
jgi:hypothetical protein